MESQTRKQTDIICQLRRTNSQLEQQLQDVKTNRDNAILEHEEEIIELRNQVQELHHDMKIQQDELQECEQANSYLNEQIEQLSRENARKDTQIQQLQSENQQLQSEIQHFQSDAHAIGVITENKAVEISNNVLGRGGWGAVSIGYFYRTKVAVKEYHEIILSPYNQKVLEREISIASQCHHPNLLQFLCATKNDSGQLLIVTELMDMSLRNLLEQRAQKELLLEHHEMKQISVDVALGCWYLHSKKPHPIIHRDISSANVLLQIKNMEIVRAKISDYGSANFKQLCKTANPGAPLYAAPEASQAKQDPKVI